MPTPQRKKVSIADILSMKNKERISVITAYDYCSAQICDAVGIEILLVGDSAAMVVLGHPTTTQIGMAEMLIFCGAVARGAKGAMVVGDMPFGSYQPGISVAIDNAVKMVKSGCDAIKLEGGKEVAMLVSAIAKAGIPVMGHIGFKPQTAGMWDSHKLQGKTWQSAQSLLADAIALQDAGAFALVLEMVTAEVAMKITSAISIPTIGIGSGNGCDGQVLVLHDLLGMYEDMKPKFAARYADLAGSMHSAVSRYVNEVKEAKFPEETHTFHMNPEELSKWKQRTQ